MKTFLIALLAVFIVIQFFRPAKNISTAAPSQNDIAAMYHQPDNVSKILYKACNDCHTNNTRYPWYNNVQPVAWFLNHHVQEGKGELNFNEFGTYSLRRQYHKLEELEEMVKNGEMPLASYTFIHTNAKLNDQEKLALTDWVTSIQDTMKAKYPIDSLIRKKK